MTRPDNHRSFAFVSSMLAAALLSVVAAFSSVVIDPIATNGPSGVSDQPVSQHHFRISPIPPGADWTTAS